MADRARKQAACLPCRRSKTKCHWHADQRRCQRCAQIGCECTRGEYHVGRQKGTKNKRVGLDKALFQIEQAVERASSADKRSIEDEKIVKRLRALLGGVESIESSLDEEYHNGDDTDDRVETGETNGIIADHTPLSGDSQAIESAESPLQLLAASHRASRRPTTTTQPKDASKLGAFFAPAHVSLDVGEDIDPISLGLVSEEEAESMITFFHTNLSHTRWGLDSRIYDMAFTRSRSAFLLTSVMAASALFMPHAGALSKRLSNHIKPLVYRVIHEKHKSVEIVLAFMVNLPWMFPGERSADDETCFYVATALQIAIDLGLHKVLALDQTAPSASRPSIGRGESLDARVALAMDGFQNTDPSSQRGRLLLRGRERCWISLYAVERGMCLARGRPFITPLTRLIKECDGWHRSDLADKEDGPLLSIATMRRDLDGLFTDVRTLCDSSQGVAGDGSLEAQAIQSAIEHFFNQWHAEYDSSIGTGPDNRLPPYIEILITHTRLSIYGGLINHPTAPLEVRQFFRTAGLSSALNVMRVAIQGESRLLSMPNNTSIMISFAACFALTLSTYVTGNTILAPSIREVIDQSAGLLERIGSVTPHRNGPSTLYARQLRQILKDRITTATQGTVPSVDPVAAPSMQQEPLADPIQESSTWPDTFQFSTMSDMEISQVLNQPGNGFEPYFDGMSWDDFNNFDWLQWPESI
ncbi:hypothetical protein M409DRAFT_36298 [Zasmidium cellare ATCC 36951]|uniref:Zn(2)-C6 fungal-type domain-containing protein n=1 Tax=Zasmidium cellare ATCC 36951 TaxID=1080233 RepID=A0A6A6CRB9_ZASCE|nr:uncharacterized protein M409DRAFT_36298 [Zasmidium cellare ATCC 36951]KAF2168718.1 hypothetical protein M409DRAFT_36298 [Zasmidium cellare ATCC 36951]